MRSIALMFHSDWHDKAWGNLLQSVTTGEVAFDSVYGMPIFDWFEENPEAARVYNEANAIKAMTSHRAIIDAYDFSGIDTLTHIGGGNAALMAEILEANPKMRGIVADRPPVIKEASELIQARGLQARGKLMDCDFFKEIPAGSDAYLMSHILHDWNDEHCQMI